MPDEKPLPPPPDDINALPPGTRFGELEIIKLIGTGGFGLVYLAHDHALERLVAIKEYMPGNLAQRGANSQVSVRSGSLRETFELGLRSFVNEARLLARFDHRSLLKVFRFWEANNTAYMVVPYLQGQTLKQWRDASGVAPSGDWLMQKLQALLGALEVLHAERVYHRDIAPDNIFLPQDGGDPILLDFGAARRAISDTTQSFTAILKPSYAPLEQYDGASSLRQGPWTDLYALGAVLYHLLTGHPPAAATRRALADDFQPLRPERFPDQPERLLQAVNWALALRPGDRPQSVAEWRQGLNGEREMPATPPPPPDAGGLSELAKVAQPDEPTQLLQKAEAVVPPAMARTAPATVPLRNAAPEALAAPAAKAPEPATAKGQPAWVPLGLVAAVLLLAAFWWVLRGSPSPAPGSDPMAAASAPVGGAAVASAPAASEALSGLAPGEVFVEPARPASQAVPAPAPVAPPPTTRPARTEPRPPAATSANTAPAQRPPAAAPAPAADAASIAASPEPRPAASAVDAATGAADPLEACGKRVFISRALCIDRRCREPAYAQHPECQRLREMREQREKDRERF